MKRFGLTGLIVLTLSACGDSSSATKVKNKSNPKAHNSDEQVVEEPFDLQFFSEHFMGLSVSAALRASSFVTRKAQEKIAQISVPANQSVVHFQVPLTGEVDLVCATSGSLRLEIVASVQGGKLRGSGLSIPDVTARVRIHSENCVEDNRVFNDEFELIYKARLNIRPSVDVKISGLTIEYPNIVIGESAEQGLSFLHFVLKQRNFEPPNLEEAGVVDIRFSAWDFMDVGTCTGNVNRGPEGMSCQDFMQSLFVVTN